MKILVANGVNLDLLGSREPAIYGSQSLADIESILVQNLDVLCGLAGKSSATLEFYQSNDEASFLSKISEGWDGILLNPGAWTHTSLALADRLSSQTAPYVEVHLSNISNREEFRKHSFCSAHAAGVVYGLGVDSYLSGLLGLLKILT